MIMKDPSAKYEAASVRGVSGLRGCLLKWKTSIPWKQVFYGRQVFREIMSVKRTRGVEMNKRNFAAILIAAVMCAGLAGCGENAIPDMTDEQVKMIGEYVAVTMMKYDANHRSRLVDLPEDKKPQPPAEPEATKEPSGMGDVADTPVIDPSAPENQYSMEEVLGLPEGVTLAFSGQKLCDVYPDAGENEAFSLSASKGKRLLVLSYTLNNASGQEQEVNILASGASFRVTANEGRSRRVLLTNLPQDMATYVGTVPANSVVEAVLLVEVDEETVSSGVETVLLNVKNDTKSYTESLQ